MSVIALELPQEIIALKDGLARFIDTEVIPRHHGNRELFEDERRLYEPDGRYVPQVVALKREVRMASAKAGYYTMCAPESLGGAGLGRLAYFVAWEEIFRRCGGHYWLGYQTIAGWTRGPSPVLDKVTPRAREEILATMMTGERTMCFGMSEPDAGSDVQAMRTRATADGDGWRISGRKIWTTSSPGADWIIVFAVSDSDAAAARKGGISAFLVPTSAPGFQIQRIVRMMGSAGGDEAEIVLDDIKVEPWQLVGTLHKGLAIGLLGVSLGRVYNMARAVGLGRWGLEMALNYAATRRTFGKPIAEYQGVSFPLAESAMELHGAHLMALNCAQLLDRGLPAIKEMSMAKSYAVAAGTRALDRAMQVHGAMGFTNELGLTEAWGHIRRAGIADGSHEIMKRTIAQRLFAGDTEV